MTDRLLPGSLRSAADLLQKVRRDAALLDDEVTSDRFFNFVVTAYSLIDWIDHDPTVSIAAKAPAEIAALRADQWLLLCGDAATGAKHFKLTRRTPTAAKVSVASGYGVGRYGKGKFGVGEEHITVHMPDGRVYRALELVRGVLDTWAAFFSRHGLPVRKAMSRPNKRLKLPGARVGRIALPRLRAQSAVSPPCACGRCARSLSAIR